MNKYLIVAAIALIIGAGSAYKAQGWRYATQIAAIHAQHATASQQAVTNALEEERRRHSVVNEASQQGEQDIEQIRADVATAADDATRLREQLAAVRKRARTDNARLATKWATASQTIAVLTRLLEGFHDHAGTVSGAYEDARARGLTCERAYDGVRGE